MARHRSFGSQFKRQVAREFLDGRAGLHELARRYSLSRNLIRLWIRKYEDGEFNDELAEAVHVAEDEGSGSAQKGGAAGTAAQRRELLHRERPQAVSIARGCRIMKLVRSTYYY